jgi:uncharacterized protein YjiK
MGSYQTIEPPRDFGKAALEYQRAKLKSRQRARKLLIGAGLLSVIVIALLAFRGNFSEMFETKSNGKNKSATAAVDGQSQKGVTVLKEWDMPDELREISGLSYLDDERLACVQDEIGAVYIYNIKTSKIEKEIPFAGTGDYEGLAVVDKAVWVLRADGSLFEISDINAAQPVVKEYDTHLTVAQDTEGLCYDPDNKRLLVTVKEKDPGSDTYKGIYAFDLGSRTMATTPAFKIDLQHEVFANAAANEKKKKAGAIMPAAIAIHPVSKEMFITDGPKSRLLVTNKDGSIKKFLQLDSKKFMQPEGITFNKQGELFISNEGKDVPGNILKVEVGSE